MTDPQAQERLFTHAEVVRIRAEGVEAGRREAAAQLDALTDRPEFDATDGAHPAWWRGHDASEAKFREKIDALTAGLAASEAARKKFSEAFDSLQGAPENWRCLVAHPGESTYECAIEAPCAVCVARGKLAALTAQMRADTIERAALYAQRSELKAQLDALTAELAAARSSPDAARCGECGTVWLASSTIDDLSELVEPHRQEAKKLRAQLATALQQCSSGAAKLAAVERIRDKASESLGLVSMAQVLEWLDVALTDAPGGKVGCAHPGFDPLTERCTGCGIQRVLLGRLGLAPSDQEAKGSVLRTDLMVTDENLPPGAVRVRTASPERGTGGEADALLTDVAYQVIRNGGIGNHGHRTPTTACAECQIVNRLEAYVVGTVDSALDNASAGVKDG
jgi:hypothetical protein